MQGNRWWMLVVTCLSVLVVALDLTVLNIALPTISRSLHANTGDLQWVVDAYSLSFAAVMLPAGIIGDRFGRKRILMAGLVVFLGASILAALANTTGELIAARAEMGLGAAAVFPISLATVSSSFDDEERPKAVGTLTAVVALGLPAGPIVGGLLLQHFSWNSVFWINVPAVCITLVAGAFLIPNSRNPEAPPLDVLGALLSAGSVTALAWGLINGPEHGWSAPATWALLIASAVLFAAYLARERRAPHRLIDPALFRDRRFGWGTAATVAVSVALFGIMFVFPQYEQSVLGYGPISAGLRLLPMMGGLLIAGGAASPIAKAAGTRLSVSAGLVLLVAGLIVLSRIHLGDGYTIAGIGLGICGLGIGASIAAAMDAVMAAAGGDEAGVGAAVNSTLRQVGGAIAVAVLGSVLADSYTGMLRPELSRLPADQAATALGSITEAAQIAQHLPNGAWLAAAAGRAYLHGMSAVMLVCAGLAVVATFTSLRYLPGRRPKPAAPSVVPQAKAKPEKTKSDAL